MGRRVAAGIATLAVVVVGGWALFGRTTVSASVTDNDQAQCAAKGPGWSINPKDKYDDEHKISHQDCVFTETSPTPTPTPTPVTTPTPTPVPSSTPTQSATPVQPSTVQSVPDTGGGA